MDKSELIKIVVTAVVTVCARELFTFIVKHSKTAAAAFKRLAMAVLKKHWMLLPAALHGLMFAYFCYVVLFMFTTDDTVATRRFVAAFAFGCYCLVSSGNNFINAIVAYRHDRSSNI